MNKLRKDTLMILSSMEELKHVPMAELEKHFSEFIDKMNSKCFVVETRNVIVPLPEYALGFVVGDMEMVGFNYNGRGHDLNTDELVITNEGQQHFVITEEDYICPACREQKTIKSIGGKIVEGGQTFGEIETCMDCGGKRKSP